MNFEFDLAAAREQAIQGELEILRWMPELRSLVQKRAKQGNEISIEALRRFTGLPKSGAKPGQPKKD